LGGDEDRPEYARAVRRGRIGGPFDRHRIVEVHSVTKPRLIRRGLGGVYDFDNIGEAVGLYRLLPRFFCAFLPDLFAFPDLWDISTFSYGMWVLPSAPAMNLRTDRLLHNLVGVENAYFCAVICCCAWIGNVGVVRTRRPGHFHA